MEAFANLVTKTNKALTLKNKQKCKNELAKS